MAKSNSERLAEARKKREEEKKSSSSSSSTKTYKNSEKLEKLRMERSIDIGTFEKDLKEVGTTINTVHGNWQTEETMRNTKTSVQTMRDRIDTYQKYRSKFGGADLSSTLKAYDEVLGKWDDTTKVYGQYQNADAFGKAKQKAQFDFQFSKKDKDGNIIGGLTYDEVQEELKKHKEGSAEHEYLKGYTNYSNSKDFDKALDISTQKQKQTLELEDAKKRHLLESTVSKWMNEGKRYMDIPSDEMEKFVDDTGVDAGLVMRLMNGETSFEDLRAILPNDAPDFTLGYTDSKQFDENINAIGYNKDYHSALEIAKNKYKLENGVNDEYAHYRDKDDFAEMSQYKSTIKEKPNWDGVSIDVENEAYEYINNVNGSRDKVFERYEGVYGSNARTKTEYEDKFYHLLEPEEVQLYNYLFAEDKKNGTDNANKYLEGMEVVLAKRQNDIDTGKWKEESNGVLGGIGSSIASIPANVFGGVSSLLGNTLDKLQGKEYNPYASYNMGSNYASTVRENVGKNIAENTDWEILGTNVPSLLYQTSMSMGDTIVGGATLGKLYTISAGSNAFQQKAKELKEAGESEEVIIGNALASGLAEAGFEYISLDKLIKINGVTDLKTWVKASLKQAGIEGSEELATEISNIAFDEWFRGSNSQLSQLKKDLVARGFTEEEAYEQAKNQMIRQVGEAFAGGVLSGFGLGGGKGIISGVTNSKTGNTIQTNERTGEVLDFMENMTQKEADAYKLFTQYSKKGVNADNIKPAQLGNLYNTAVMDNAEISRSKKYSDDDRANAIANLDTLGKMMTSKTEEQKKREDRMKSLARGEVTEVTATGNSASIEGIKVENGEITVATSEGEFSAKEMTFSDKDAELISYAEDKDGDVANLFVSLYDGNTNIDAFNDSFNLAVKYAENNLSQDEMLKKRGVLTPDQVGTIYTSIVTNEAKAQSKVIAKIMEKHANKMAYNGTINDSVIDYNNKTTDGSKVNWKDLTDSQRRGVTFLTGLAKATGLDVEVVTDGKERGFHGAYVVENGKILIDVYAGIDKTNMAKDSKDTIVSSFAHELTHWSEVKSPEKYQSLSEDIFKVLTRGGKSESQLIDEEISRLANNNIKADEKYARNEIISRACEDMLALSNTGKEMFNSLSETEQKSLYNKVKDLVKDFVNWVNELLPHYQSKSNEAKFLRKYKEDLLELADKWDAMFKESVAVNQAMKHEGITDNDIKESANSQQLSDRDSEGNQSARKIAPNMSDSERYEILKSKKMALAFVDDAKYKRALEKEPALSDEHLNLKDAKKLLNKIGKEFGVFTSYENTDVELKFEFGSNNLRESVSKQKAGYTSYVQMLSCLSDVISNAVGIECHNKNEEGYKEDKTLKMMYVLCSAFETQEEIIPVKLEIKEFKDKPNRLYVAISLNGIQKDRVVSMGVPNSRSHVRTSPVTISVSDLLSNINRNDLSFVKYIPKQFLENTSDASKEGQVAYSDRDSEYQSLSNEVETYRKQYRTAQEELKKYKLPDINFNAEDLDAEIEKYNKWQEESGYGEVNKKLESIRNKLRDAERKMQNLADELREEMYTNFTEEDVKKYVSKAVRKYHTTSLLSKASYLTTTGSMLDFSDGQRYRVKDHREISEILDLPSYAEYSDGMITFMNMGNIRLQSYGVDISSMPNSKQISALRNIIYKMMSDNGEFYLDVSDYRGNNVFSMTYGEKTSVAKIISDIKNYFSEGTIPEQQSSLAGFYYSDRDTDGNILSKEQIDHHKNSKIRDNKGNLKVMYHGSGSSFTVFDKKKAKSSGYYGSGFYFTESSTHAQQYGSNYKVYLNITEPLQEGTNNITKAQLKKFVKAVAENEDYGIDNYGHNATVESVTNTVYGKDDFGMLMDINASCVGDMVEAVMLFNEVNGTSYDGIIVPTETVAFYPNQIKNVDNTNPTEHEDIRYSDRDIDAWLDNLSIDELMDYLMTYDPIDTSSTTQETKAKKQRAKRRVDEVNKRLKEIGLSFNGTKSVAWTDERIDTYLSGGYYGASNPIYAQAYITYMTPQQFLNLTMGGHEYTVDTILRESESYGELDFDKIANSEPIHLDIEEGKKGAKVYGHEGRHRMYLLGKAGFEKVPVLLFDTSTKYTKTNKESLKLETQKFYNDAFISKTRDVVVSDLIPFSQGNRDLIIQKFGSGNQVADIHYSDRFNEDSVYDIMGENEALKKINKILKEDVQRLRKRVKLEGTVTNGKVFDANQLHSLAVYLNKSVNSAYSSKQLSQDLERLYSYIAQSKDLDEQTLFAKCNEIAGNILAEQRGEKVVNQYYADVLKDLRSLRISLSEEQIEELKYNYGDNYRNAFFGKIMLAKDGISLDSAWQELSGQYPELFQSDVTDVDQASTLLEIYDAVKESSVIYEKYQDAESTMELAFEIYNKYWTAPRVKTVADKYTDEIKKLNFEHRKATSDMRADFNDRLQKQKTADAIHYGKIINDLRQRERTRVQEAREFGRRRVNEVRDRAERNAKIKSITDKALVLNKWLNKNSKDEHIIEPMKPIVVEFLNAIDFSSKRSLATGGMNPTQKDIRLQEALHNVYKMMQDSNAGAKGDESLAYYGAFFPDGFVEEVGRLCDNVRRIIPKDTTFTLNDMSIDDLKTLDNLVSIIKKTVRDANAFHVANHRAGVESLVMEEVKHCEELGDGKVSKGAMGFFRKFINWDSALPVYVFDRLGEAGQKIFGAFQDGWDKFAFNVNTIKTYTEEAYTKKEVKEWEKDVKTIEIGEGKKIKLTTSQIMALHCLNKREQARLHIYGDGIRVEDFEDGKHVIRQTKPYKMTEQDVNKILSTLTQRQVEVADKLQKFMNTVCTEWGNEITMKLYGIAMFGEEEFYFPIQINDNNKTAESKDNENSIFRLLNMSFTKKTDKNARNDIMVRSIFDVFAQHTSDMAKYNSLALPVTDAFKWYNFKTRTEDGDIINTKTSLESAFGKEIKGYITTLLKDINGEKNVGSDILGSKFYTNFKIASVGANLRVSALQPTSYVRAMAVINPVCMAKAFGKMPNIKDAKKYCGMALWKSLGFYDTNIQRGLTSLIKHDDTIKDKAIEKSMLLTQKADEITWGYLWNACAYEVKAKRKDLQVNSEEFKKEVANRLRDVIYRTQVVDSTMTRSQQMRSGDGWDKLLTAFASEPTLSMNLLFDCCNKVKLDARKNGVKKAIADNKKHVARTLIAYTLTATMCALVEAGFDVMRDEEEDEEKKKKYKSTFLNNLMLDLSINAKLPFVKDIVSAIQGYSISVPYMQWAESLIKALDYISKGKTYKATKYSLKAFSYFTGLPAFNIWRDSSSILDARGILTYEELKEMFGDSEELKELFDELKGKDDDTSETDKK